jgi:uncharacterized protein YbaA (DUF1428 family)
MANYVDGFVLPIPRKHLDLYKDIAKVVATIWKEHGAIAYYEYVGDDIKLEGTRTFHELAGATEDEAIIFGWTVFESRESRYRINELVVNDPRMTDLIAPLTDPSRLIFDFGRMVFGGFLPIVESE